MANKKINQLVLKTTIQPTDLFPLGDATTGQLFKKTVAELQAAIGGAVISVNGLVGTVVLDTDDIAELATPTNRYFTEARARAAISLTTTGNSGASTYSNSTGVLNVPTYTLAGLGGITASFLSGGTGITYNSSTGVIAYSGTVYTDASIRALFSAGTGITYNSSTGAISYSGTVYTDSSIRGLFSLTTTGTSGASTYNNTTGVINVPNYTLAGLGGIAASFLSATAPISYNSSTGVISISQANGTTNGFLSSTDWNTFNGKQSALTLGNVSEVVSNVLMFPDGGTNKTIGNLTIQVVQAGSTTNGFLSTTDWNTFNNKQNALTNPVTGTGTTNYIAKWTSSSAIGISQIFDNGTNVGIGTASPNSILAISSSVTNNNVSPESQVTITNTNSGNHSTLGFRTTDSDGTHGRAGITVTKDSGSISGAMNFVVRKDSGTFLQAIRITSTANVGIGTASPLYSTHIVNNGGNAFLGISNQGSADGNRQLRIGFGGNGSHTYASIQGTRYNTADDVNLIMQAGGGNVGIGTSSTGFNAAGLPLVVGSGSGNTGMTIFSGASSSGSIHFADAETTGNASFSGFINYDHSGNSMQFGTTNTERMRIATNGFVTFSSSIVTGNDIFTNTNGGIFFAGSGNYNSGIFQVVGTGGGMALQTSSTIRIFLTPGGNILMGTTTDNGERLYVSGSIRATGSITANSDVRLKKNIERIENALQKVSEISGYTYNTIYDEDRHAGVIAQEIDKVLPEIVNKGNDGLMGVEYGNISALLIEAIKEQKVLIESLQAKVEALSK
jgi:hypothetical protein